MEKKIDFVEALKFSVSTALANVVPLLIATFLWLITIWIPYLNVGTTIAMCTIPLELSKGKMISPLFIFNKKYFDNMGLFFILSALVYSAVFIGFVFMTIPGIVISISMSLAMLLLLDKNLDPIQAIKKSCEATNGQKWSMFFANIVLVIAFYVVLGIVTWILSFLFDAKSLVSIILMLFLVPLSLSLQAYFYKVLILDAEVIDSDEAPQACSNPQTCSTPDTCNNPQTLDETDTPEVK